MVTTIGKMCLCNPRLYSSWTIRGIAPKSTQSPLLYLLVSYSCPPERTFYGLIITVVPIGAQL